MKRLSKTRWVMALCFGLAGSASAQSVVWANPGSGSWFTPGNWSTGTVPGPGSNPIIANGGTAEIDAPGANSDTIIVGSNGSGNLVVRPAGTAVPTYDLRIAQQFATDTGVVTVAGGSVTSRYVQIAKMGHGTLILDAGTLRAVGAMPSVRLGEGAGGVGNLRIGGGVFEAANSMRFGYAADSAAHAVISGGLLKINSGTLQLSYAPRTTSTFVQTGGTVDVPALNLNEDAGAPGYAEIHLGGGTNRVAANLNNVWGRAKVVVTNGLLQVAQDFYLANGALSSGEFEMSGGTVEVGRELYLALGADTTNRVTLSGGMLRVAGVACMARLARSHVEMVLTNSSHAAFLGEVRVGENAGGTAFLAVSGGELTATNGILGIGHYGQGTLNLTDGTVIAKTMSIGRYTGATGVVNMCGGVLKAGEMTKSSAAVGTFAFTGGTLAVDKYSGSMGALVNAGGTVSPGHDEIGVTYVEHNYTETTTQGGLHVQLGGTEQGSQYDWLNVPNGTVTLKGNLSIALTDGFERAIAASDKFYVAESPNAIQGTFNNVASGSRLKVSGGGSFRVFYGSSSGSEPHNKVTLTGFMHDGSVISIR